MGSITEIMGRTVLQTAPQQLKQMIQDMIVEADEIMGGKLTTDNINFTANWLYKWLGERYGYLPMHHVRTAVISGAMGERGGTSTLIPRNINIWLREQTNIHQEQMARMIKSQDEKARNEYFNANKAEWQVAAAVRIKVTWLGEGIITSEEYDSFSSKAIYDLLKSGVKEMNIRPKDVVPDYEKHKNL